MNIRNSAIRIWAIAVILGLFAPPSAAHDTWSLATVVVTGTVPDLRAYNDRLLKIKGGQPLEKHHIKLSEETNGNQRSNKYQFAKFSHQTVMPFVKAWHQTVENSADKSLRITVERNVQDPACPAGCIPGFWCATGPGVCIKNRWPANCGVRC